MPVLHFSMHIEKAGCNEQYNNELHCEEVGIPKILLVR